MCWAHVQLAISAGIHPLARSARITVAKRRELKKEMVLFLFLCDDNDASNNIIVCPPQLTPMLGPNNAKFRVCSPSAAANEAMGCTQNGVCQYAAAIGKFVCCSAASIEQQLKPSVLIENRHVEVFHSQISVRQCRLVLCRFIPVATTGHVHRMAPEATLMYVIVRRQRKQNQQNAGLSR